MVSIIFFALVATATAHLQHPLLKRAYFDTGYGQVHYAHGGCKDSEYPPLVLLHGHPRSIAEFYGVIDALAGKYSFVAIDYFGHGGSDDLLIDGPVEGDEFSQIIVDIVESLGFESFIPVGSAKGTYVALELAYSYPTKVPATVHVNPLTLSDENAANVAFYIQYLATPPGYGHTPPDMTGSYLIDLWEDTGALPFSLEGKVVHAADEVRARVDGWKYSAIMLPYLVNNSQVMLDKLTATTTASLVVWGGQALADWEAGGLTPYQARADIEAALGSPTVLDVEGGGEGLPDDNSTVLAEAIDAFLSTSL